MAIYHSKTALSTSAGLYILDTHESRSPVPSLHSSRIGYPGPPATCRLTPNCHTHRPCNWMYKHKNIIGGGGAASGSLAIYVSWS